jgi:hypothetical protein
MPLLEYKLGGFLEAGDKTAERLVASGYWKYVTQEEVVQAPESDADETNTQPESDDTPDVPEVAQQPSERPDVSDVRAWAKEHNVQVSAKGRVSADVYEQYAEAHQA